MTLVELYRTAFTQMPRNDAFRFKVNGAWNDVSSAAALQRVEAVAAALHKLGIQPGDRVALLSENRVEWALADLGILTAGAATVPVYPTLTAMQAKHILGDSEARVVIVSSAAQLEKVKVLAPELPMLTAIFILDPPADLSPAAHAGAEGAVPIRNWQNLLDIGTAALAQQPGLARQMGDQVEPGFLATLISTSGTTGVPKGVELTHANLRSNVRDALLDFDISPTDSCLSVLPLSHIFERMAGHYTMISRGVSIAYAESIDLVAANLAEVRPTILFAVPRLFEKIYLRVLDKALAGTPVKRAIFDRAREVALRWSRAQAGGAKAPGGMLALQHRLYDGLVYKTLRQRVGGRIRFFVSGGAPLAPEIAEFFGGCGLPVLEGYGLTETSPVIAVNRPARNKPGSVGPPIANVEVKIASDGEIVIKSPGVMRGYFRLPDETAKAIVDGWFLTGDIGHLDADGFLVITDRKKDLLVTAGGKNVAPQPIENAIKASKYVAECVLLGDRRAYCTALLVPNFEQLEAWATHKGLKFASRAELLAQPEVNALYEREIEAATKDLARFEQVKKFTLLDKEFTLDNGELTPTLKVKRKVINQRFGDKIEAMYKTVAGPAA
ncbi:MAG: long-chain fatty acid--CoA ligase [Candidatus Eisenbacteria bacterium]